MDATIVRTPMLRTAFRPLGLERMLLGMTPHIAGPVLRGPAPPASGMVLEVLSEDGDFVVRAHVPGIAPGDLDVSVEDEILTVRATRQEAKEEKREDYWYSEIRKGSFSRSLRLPEGIGGADFKAVLADGVLTLRAPLPEGGDLPPAVVRVPIGSAPEIAPTEGPGDGGTTPES